MSTNVRIDNVTKKYGDFVAIKDVSLDIKEGEFFTLLGPSGCGKTTLLRMIAGFNTIEAGNIYFSDKRINDLAAHKRDIGMVFQNYAIFPHLTIYQNVEYGLKARKVPAAQRNKRILETLRMVQIEDLKDRMPSDLSGGQQQRVALARAIVIEPKILLMDEPLSNLDAKLRVQMRTIIKKLQRSLNITTVYVTHDQEEALAISDRIAVMNQGKIMQLDSPDIIYRRPANQFVANFIGISNFLHGTANGRDITVGNYAFTKKTQTEAAQEVLISVRPEQFVITDSTENTLKGEIILATFLGDFINYEIRLEDGSIIEVNEYTEQSTQIRSESKVYLKLKENSVNVYDASGEENLNG